MFWSYLAVVAVLLFLFVYFVDADLATFLCDLYRRKIRSQTVKSFNDKNAWIVGASSGIGEYLAYELVKEGCRSLILSSRRKNELERVKNNCLKIRNKNISIMIIPLDLQNCVTNNENTQLFTETFIESTLKQHNQLTNGNIIDLLILNSGIIQWSLAHETSFNATKKIIDINLLSIIQFSRTFVNYFIKTKNSKSNSLNIAITSSLAGKTGTPGSSSYAMSKFGLIGYFQAFGWELKGLGYNNIDITVICPGPIEMTDSSRGGINGNMNNIFDRSIFEAKIPHMSLIRHSQLYLSAIYGSKYGINESWIAPSFIILTSYLNQFFPFWLNLIGYHLFAKHFLKRVIDVQKESKTSQTKLE